MHGKDPKVVAQIARKAWLALVATPILDAVVIAGGQAVFSALGYGEEQTLPAGQRVQCS